MSDEFDEFDDDLDLAQLDEAELQSLERIEQPSVASGGPRVSRAPAHASHDAFKPVTQLAPPLSSLRTPQGARPPVRSADDTFDQFDIDDEFLIGLDELDSQLSGDRNGSGDQRSRQTAGEGPQNPLFFATSSPVGSSSSAPGKITRPPAQRPAGGSIASNAKAGPSSRPLQLGVRPLGRTISSSYARATPASGPTATQGRGSSSGHRQMTLFGDALPTSTPAKILPISPGHISASGSSAAQNGGSAANGSRQRQPTTKQWDRTAYAKSGPRSRTKAKGKDRETDEWGAGVDDDDDDDEDGGGVWDAGSKYENKAMPLPTDQMPQPIKPMKLQIDREAANTWIYPINMERRDYQYNIVQRALFNNVLVALPTGLGKTFIAAVVILNFFRWYPEGKIVFLAPTRPLVDQQKIACHRICGLPWETAIDLTGSTKRSLRGDHWKDKRIFYMTPQTFENDLETDECDPRDIVCVVVDEAHRATGRYSYCNVISKLMQANPHFRVLALTATPGSNAERVQEVIDRLHIGVIEIRTEGSLDLMRYVHKKHEETRRIVFDRDLKAVRDKWSRLMRTHMDTLSSAGLLHQTDPILLHPFAVRSLLTDPRHKPTLRAKPQLFKPIKELAEMATLMQHMVEQSITMFYTRLLDKQRGVDDQGKKSATKKQQRSANNNSTYRDIIRELEIMQDSRGRIPHPKMVALRQLVEEHFSKHKIDRILAEEAAGSDDDETAPTPHETRVMVFCSFRECVTEIVDFLNESGLQVTPFVGQATTKKGERGMRQKEQEAVIQQFKKGKFNVLVATSIGEEGLDIGDVDLTVCYDTVKDSIRMLQRVGRTGRKRDGRIVVLMSEGREEANWNQSKESYKAVQNDINSGLAVELYDDVDRMVPRGINPVPELKKVDQPTFEPSMITDGRKATRSKAAAGTKRKRNDDPARNIPTGTITGFFKASRLTKKRGSKVGDGSNDDDDDDDESSDNPAAVRRKKMLLESSQSESEAKRSGPSSERAGGGVVSEDSDSDGDSDKLLNEGFGGICRAAAAKRALRSAPTTSTPVQRATSSAQPAAAAQEGSQSIDRSARRRLGIRRAAVAYATSTPTTKAKADCIEILDSSQETSAPAAPASKGVLRGSSSVNGVPPPLNGVQPRKSDVTFASSTPRAAKRKTIPDDEEEDDEFGSMQVDSDVERQIGDITQAARPGVVSILPTSDDIDEEPSTSPVRPYRLAPHPIVAQLAAEIDAQEREKARQAGDPAGIIDDEDEASSPIKMAGRAGPSVDRGKAPRAEDGETPTAPVTRRRAPRRILSTSSQSPPPSPLPPQRGEASLLTSSPPHRPAQGLMGPPDSVPRRAARPSVAVTDPDESPLVRPMRPRRRLVPAAAAATAGGSSEAGPSEPTTPPRRTKKARTSNPATAAKGGGGEEGKKKGKKKKRIGASPTSRALFRYEADRSTDEEAHGERDENDEGLDSDDEDDEDRRAVGHFEPTQAPKGYNQRSVYMGSLLTQNAPTPFRRPNRGPFPGVGGRYGHPIPRSGVPSSSMMTTTQQQQQRYSQDSMDRYSEDSFVVGDDEEIVYDSDVERGSSQL